MPTLEPPDTMIDVGVGVERVEDRIVFVGHQAGKVDETAVALDEGGEHRSVGVGDAIPVRLRTGRQQLVAGHHQPHPRPAEHAHVSDADRTEHAQVLRTQHASGAGAAWFPRTMSSPRLPTCLPGDTAASALTRRQSVPRPSRLRPTRRAARRRSRAAAARRS